MERAHTWRETITRFGISKRAEIIALTSYIYLCHCVYDRHMMPMSCERSRSWANSSVNDITLHTRWKVKRARKGSPTFIQFFKYADCSATTCSRFNRLVILLLYLRNSLDDWLKNVINYVKNNINIWSYKSIGQMADLKKYICRWNA